MHSSYVVCVCVCVCVCACDYREMDDKERLTQEQLARVFSRLQPEDNPTRQPTQPPVQPPPQIAPPPPNQPPSRATASQQPPGATSPTAAPNPTVSVAGQSVGMQQQPHGSLRRVWSVNRADSVPVGASGAAASRPPRAPAVAPAAAAAVDTDERASAPALGRAAGLLPHQAHNQPQPQPAFQASLGTTTGSPAPGLGRVMSRHASLQSRHGARGTGPGAVPLNQMAGQVGPSAAQTGFAEGPTGDINPRSNLQWNNAPHGPEITPEPYPAPIVQQQARGRAPQPLGLASNRPHEDGGLYNDEHDQGHEQYDSQAPVEHTVSWRAIRTRARAHSDLACAYVNTQSVACIRTQVVSSHRRISSTSSSLVDEHVQVVASLLSTCMSSTHCMCSLKSIVCLYACGMLLCAVCVSRAFMWVCVLCVLCRRPSSGLGHPHCPRGDNTQ